MLLTCQPPSHAIFGIVFIFHVYSVPVCALVLGCVLYHSYVLYMLCLAMLFFFWFYHFPLIEYFSSRIVFALSCIILYVILYH